MEAVLVSAKKKSDLTILVSLAKKLGMSAKSLSKTEIEDWHFAQKIDAGMKSAKVSRTEIMKALGK
jgi:hypothetical protein